MCKTVNLHQHNVSIDWLIIWICGFCDKISIKSQNWWIALHPYGCLFLRIIPFSFLCWLIIILLGDSKMKGRESSYSTAPGAVIFLSKWAVFVSGPWEGIFSCVGRQCAETDSNTQRTSPLVLTHKHTTGDEAGVFLGSPYTERKWKNIFDLLVYCSTTPFTL